MKFETKLIPATLVRRYKRFLADVELADGSQVTVHCANTGAMLGCQAPGSRVWLSRSDNPTRKYPLSWELVEAAPNVLVGIHTGRTNRLVEEALREGPIELGCRLAALRREVTIGQHRFDFVAETTDGDPIVIEVKNVTAVVESRVALFPDAISSRGASHVRCLAQMQRSGTRCALIYCVQREDVDAVRSAREIDPEYAAAVTGAAKAGVEIAAWGCTVSSAEIRVVRRLEVRSGG